MSDHKFNQGRRGRPSPSDRCHTCGVRRTEHPNQTEFYDYEILTLQETARFLKTNVRNVERLIQEGCFSKIELNPHLPLKRMPRVVRKDLERWVDELRARRDGL